ncbi:FAD-dependent oxidoreductase [Micromonospora inositola]|uniref:D-amino-acid oxidase n=1 Tax=Micromonospora inositola TaxID=47865 RepID=A0A1C5K311_9ACTN|nr:FAD-dependent oxidoreductase [Micromonospora inositola]SCG77157.1 D-amino-acid:oxygen oxidoreductase [Micromonospora inositola]
MKVRVVGAGVVGLTSALRLAQTGHEVEVVAAKMGNGTTSSVAAALWYPYRAYPEVDVTRWSATTYEVLCDLTSDPSAGVRMRLGQELFRQHTSDPWWREAVPELGRVAVERLPTGYVDGYELSVPVVDMAMHLPWLLGQLETAGVAVRTRHVDHLAEAFEDVDAVVNCTGLGSRELIDDETLTPVRGQVIVVAQFGLTEWQLDQNDPEHLIYVVPRSDTVLLGGTAEEGDEDLNVRPETAADMLKRCIELVPALDKARILSHRVGLRPGRPTVRLETEFIDRGPVVHCYGHGGAGVTLSYGCAEDVALLVSGLS